MKKKRFLSMILALCLTFGSAAALPQGAFDGKASITASASGYGYTKIVSGDWEYYCNVDDKYEYDGTITVLNYLEKTEKITIPAKIDGKKVTGVFFTLDYGEDNNTAVKSIIIPSGVKSISGFSIFPNLQSVSIPNSVTDIGLYAFSQCTRLSSITIPSSVKTIGYSAFSGCTKLTGVTIPNGVTSIESYCFSECTSLSKINIPKSVTSIGNSAFSGCTSLKSVTIPKSVTSIGSCAFDNTMWLVNQHKKNPLVVVNGMLIDGTACNGKVTIPSSVTRIVGYAFHNCDNLTSVVIPSSVKSIESGVFYGCTRLTGVTIPKSVKSIGDAAFSHCTSLTSVKLPESLWKIGDNAFNNCQKLKKITIPDSTRYIGSEAFGYTYDSESYKKIKVNGFEINCYPGSSGEEYARKNGFAYLLIKDGKTVPVYSIGSATKSLSQISAPEGRKNDISITVHRSKDDSKTYSLFTGVNIDGKKVSSTDYTVSAGSLVLKLKADVIASLSEGEHTVSVLFKDGNAEMKLNVGKTPYPKQVRFAGANRYDTAALISKGMYSKGNDTVIIATGMTYHDAMVAVPLAKAYNAPLLLTTEKQVTKQTEAELKRLKAKKVIIVSTNGAVGTKVKTALAKYNPTMINGKTCFETASKVAKALQTKTKKAPDTIFFATDSAFADALSASPVAAVKNAPIIYLKKTGSIDKATADYLKSVKGKVKNAYVIGGDGVISNAMMNSVAKTLGLSVNKTVQRLAGKNRYETCVAVNNKFKSILTGKTVCVATGIDFPDALAGGVYAANQKAPLFLASSRINDEQRAYLGKMDLSKIYIFGGTGAVSENDATRICALLSVTDRVDTSKIKGVESSDNSKNTIRIYCFNTAFKLVFDQLYPKYTKHKVKTSSYKDWNGNLLSEIAYIDGKKVEWVQVANEGHAYQKYLDEKLQNQQSDSEKIDMFVLDNDDVQRYVSKSGMESVALSVKDLGITDKDTANMYQYTKDIATDNASGDLKALSWQSTAGLFYYDVNIAKKVLGTSDPAKVQNYVKDWDAFKQTAKKMKAKGYKMVSSYADTLRAFDCNKTSAWVKDGKLGLDTQMKKWIDQTKEFTDNGWNNKTDQWAPEWNNDMKKGAKVFGFFMPSWGVDSCLSNAGGEETKGKWKACAGPAGWYWGGQWLCGAVDSDNQDIVTDILKVMTCNKDCATGLINTYDEMPNNKAAVAAVKNTYKNSYLGGQNHLALMSESADKIDIKGKVTIYDSYCVDIILYSMRDYFTGVNKYSDCLDQFKKRVKEEYPELKI